MTELRHLQLVILGIIKDIDDVCRRNNIEYYLNSGSTLGAIRHKGFIPWDDDLDIMMTHDNYSRFLEACRRDLDPRKYYVQEELVDWPLNYSKIKLLGTSIEEVEGYAKDDRQRGIFVDVFRVDNTSRHRLLQLWQYTCAKASLAYQMSIRTYKSATWKKKLIMALATPLRIGPLRRFVRRQAVRYNDKETGYLGSFYEPKRFHSCIFPKPSSAPPSECPSKTPCSPCRPTTTHICAQHSATTCSCRPRKTDSRSTSRR